MPAKSSSLHQAAKKTAAKKTAASKAAAKKAAAKKSVTAKPATKKAVAKKPAAKKAATKKPAAAGGKHTPVRVRMYRQGLGDCFLVTFNPESDDAVHMLIDCGTLGAVTTGNEMKDIVAHIGETTGGRIHLMIATHEHQDHVSGFHTLKEKFQEIEVENVWMAWTENPGDDDAKSLMTHIADLGMAVAQAAQALTQNNPSKADTDTAEAMTSLLEFGNGRPDVLQPFLGAAKSPLSAGPTKKLATTVDDGMTFVRTGQVDSAGRPVKARYLSPGGPALEPEWLPGFRFFVLGPPREKERLKNMGKDGSSELYGMAAGLRAAASGMPGGPGQDEGAMPFDRRYWCRESDEMIRETMADYFATENDWRRVDKDWLNAASDLALQLDNMTNNTSLALAIERISDGRVLLFPADAQEGSWLSWHEPKEPFTYVQDGVRQTTTAEKLLNRTVFYKVGHHGSHNATAKGKGLEMMRSESELVAFIPVDRKVALKRSPAGQWKMPAHALYRRLLEKCNGRVARSDIGWADAPQGTQKEEAAFKNLATEAEWEKWRESQGAAQVSIDKLFIDYRLS